MSDEHTCRRCGTRLQTDGASVLTCTHCWVLTSEYARRTGADALVVWRMLRAGGLDERRARAAVGV